MPHASWARHLNTEKDATKKELLFHPHLRNGKPGDKHINKRVTEGLRNHETRLLSVAEDKLKVVAPTRYAYRSFDRQWIIPDARLINQPNPTIWNAYSNRQVYLTAPEDRAPSSGPALTFTNFIPDLHHYNGRGGRVYPLWRDAGTALSNIKSELSELLAESYGQPVSADDIVAYLAAVMTNPAFTTRFAPDLTSPGLRIPLTADSALFAESVKLGRDVIWLHCYGERYVDAGEGRPKQPPRLPKDKAPTIPTAGAIPTAPEPLPSTITFDAAKNRLHVGKGYIDHVTPQMWAYEVSGKQVLLQWFSYRRLDRSKPMIGDRRQPSPLGDIQPEGWLAEYTTDLLDMLNVLGRVIALEPAQADLLGRICDGPLISMEALQEAGIEDKPEMPQDETEAGD